MQLSDQSEEESLHRRSLREAWSLVKQSTKLCLPNIGFFTQLQTLEREIRRDDDNTMSTDDYEGEREAVARSLADDIESMIRVG